MRIKTSRNMRLSHISAAFSPKTSFAMLFHLKFLTTLWGPFRIMGSHLVLTCFGVLLAALVVWLFLPRLWRFLPRDRGKAFVKDSARSAGKPTGAGYLILLLVFPILLLVLPLAGPGVDAARSFNAFFSQTCKLLAHPASWHQLVNSQWGVVGCLFAAMISGYLDDKAKKPWGRLRKGLLDAAIALITVFVLCRGQETEIWLPFWKDPITVTCWAYLAIAAPLLWLTMNATNCSDGVDGLAGSLTLISLFSLVVLLYGIVGHETIAAYLLVPHNPEGARWAILTATIAGGLTGYLWYNAEPSKVLMGDAGSRFLGLLVGVAVLMCGNPFLVLVAAPIVLINGGTGLLKILLLKTLPKLGFETTNPRLNSGTSTDQSPNNQHPCWLARQLHKTRFPLHDHCRHNLGWTNAQVLMRFVLIQALTMPILFIILVKIR